MNFEEILKSLPEDQQNTVKAELTKAKAEMPEGAVSAEDKKKLEDELAQAKKDKGVVEEELKKVKESQNNTNPEDILKNVDPAIRAIIEKTRNQAAAAEAEIKKMKDTQEKTEALAKAKELPNLCGKPEDVADAFVKMKNADETAFSQVFGMMKAANEMISKNVNLGEVGTSGAAEDITKAADEAWTAIEKKADEIQKAKNCTKESAIAKAVSENPDLYKKYLDAQK